MSHVLRLNHRVLQLNWELNWFIWILTLITVAGDYGLGQIEKCRRLIGAGTGICEVFCWTGIR